MIEETTKLLEQIAKLESEAAGMKEMIEMLHHRIDNFVAYIQVLMKGKVDDSK